MTVKPYQITEARARALRTIRDLEPLSASGFTEAMYPAWNAGGNEGDLFCSQHFYSPRSFRRVNAFVRASNYLLGILERNAWISRGGDSDDILYSLTPKGRRRLCLYELAEETAAMGAELFRKRLTDMNRSNRSLIGGARTARVNEEEKNELDNYRMDQPDE